MLAAACELASSLMLGLGANAAAAICEQPTVSCDQGRSAGKNQGANCGEDLP